MSGLDGLQAVKAVAALEPADKPIDTRILNEAADWLLQCSEGALSPADAAACARWRQRSPEHARAWARAESLLQKLGGLPPALAMPVLDRPAHARAGRRAAVARLAALLVAAPVGWGLWRLNAQQAWSADYRTDTGEQRELTLADSTRVRLSTATAIDVHFDGAQRVIHLRAGEILITTGADARQRPFYVATAQGRMQALGTRFSVRQRPGQSHVAVFESAVRVVPADGGEPAARTLAAGQQAWFSASRVDPPSAAHADSVSWTQGMLLADKLRLGDFCNQLAAWHPGLLHCDPAVADLRISGAFPLAPPERALRMLVSTYPVDVSTRLRGYWVTLTQRD